MKLQTSSFLLLCHLTIRESKGWFVRPTFAPTSLSSRVQTKPALPYANERRLVSTTTLCSFFVGDANGRSDVFLFSGNDEDQDNLLKADDELKTTFDDAREHADDYHWFRFGSVGRLYAKEGNSVIATIEDESASSVESGMTEEAILDRLRRATVAVVGVGGIGSWTAEALARSGVGHIVLVDLDDVCMSQTNRQIQALSDNVGSFKTKVLKERLRAIQPDIRVSLVHDFVFVDNAEAIVEQFVDWQVSAVVETIDSVDEKVALWEAAAARDLSVIGCGSANGRIDPTSVQCKPLLLDGATADPVLEEALQLLQQKQRPLRHSLWGVFAPLPPEADSVNSMGVASFVSGTMGFVAAAHIVDQIARNPLRP